MDLFDSVRRYRLFDSSVQLEFELIRLLHSQDRWFSTGEISKTLKTNSNAILRIANKLAEDIEAYGDERITLSASKGKGLRLNRAADISIKGFQLSLLEDTYTIRLMRSIFHGEFETVKKYSQKHFLSEATVRRKITKLRAVLAKYDISIKREDATLEGEESQIRALMNMFYWRLFIGITWPFPNVNEEIIHSIVQDIADRLNIKFNTVTHRQIMYFLAVSIIRTRRGNFVNIKEEWWQYIEDSPLYNKFTKIMKDQNGGLNTSNDEIPFYYLIFSTRIFSLNYPELIEFHKKKKTRAYQASLLLKEAFTQEIFEIPEEKLTRFMDYSIIFHTYVDIFKKFSADLNGYVGDAYSEEYPEMKKRIDYSLNGLIERSNLDLFKEKGYLSIRYQWLAALVGRISLYEKKYTIIIELDAPKIMKEMVLEEIDAWLGIRYNCELFFIEDLSDVSQADVLLTNIPLRELDHKEQFKSVKIINIENIPTHETMRRLDKKLQSL
ncbi:MULTISPECIES: helix-turn-helix domain-containing protein [unclassified Enterococcus]|uniref:helix-turn-helix domain-containing protein n=1 Tax=unclassified Enterococcus TaxID=2608891 RepID=UPI001CE20A23|nr:MULTISPECIES: helix-turn-helix domain-containing protein [unclassified Enterococcus]MCA5014441.1 helix-turn-helix domain-containing protein [Enterococcus sp. S23]MCA5017445.1 helix-turn-helix domain-containing protein [Enterococcus sp. S22(2020)]